MTARAAHLVDEVLPWVPVRQMGPPYRVRYAMAWDHGLSRAVLGVYARVLLDVTYHPGVAWELARGSQRVSVDDRPW
jgi:hypothetical protein